MPSIRLIESPEFGRPTRPVPPDQDAGAQVPSCFRTEARLSCARAACPWRAECCRLLACWMR